MAIKLAGCILVDAQGRIGLLHRNKNGITQWELPGGKVEPNETNQEAAVRELTEELGVTVRITKLIGQAQFTHNDTGYEYVWFLASVTKGSPSVQEPETFDDFGFFAADELEVIQLSANMQKLLEFLYKNPLKLQSFVRQDTRKS